MNCNDVVIYMHVLMHGTEKEKMQLIMKKKANFIIICNCYIRS